jgi:hypothetical protein
MRRLLVSVAVVALSSGAAIAGDAEDAKAMLEKAAAIGCWLGIGGGYGSGASVFMGRPFVEWSRPPAQWGEKGEFGGRDRARWLRAH